MSAGRFTWFRKYWQQYRPSGKDVRQFLVLFGCTSAFLDNVLGFTICVGPSMMPTIDPEGELTLIDRVSYKFGKKNYQKDDVVISIAMDNPRKTVCKRIRGVEGDIVYHRNKSGQPVLTRIPAGHVWLLGDNPDNSNDSRYYGPVPLGMLQGRVFAKIGLRPIIHISDVDTIYELPVDEKVKNVETAKEGGDVSQKVLVGKVAEVKVETVQSAMDHEQGEK